MYIGRNHRTSIVLSHARPGSVQPVVRWTKQVRGTFAGEDEYDVHIQTARVR